MSSKSLFESDEDAAQANKFAKKAKESPFMLVGIAGFVAAGLIGAYKYKNRGTMSTSVFLMQLRVAAQGTVVGCLTVGLAYSMAKEYLFEKAPKENTKSLTN
ncbi:HIG1 domain family member 1A, mitochondrial [Drosophila kikkawai]|uniref:HIG1 domain family member 1A, mitochondrial n=1 Tax=Drosophila kikkawai TaxID=30033 RepID=A0A6P4HM77_DROKI|nr:HIG1 domain family member 1A, mitochondrial [Drosophila kikkawai]